MPGPKPAPPKTVDLIAKAPAGVRSRIPADLRPLPLAVAEQWNRELFESFVQSRSPAEFTRGDPQRGAMTEEIGGEVFVFGWYMAAWEGALIATDLEISEGSRPGKKKPSEAQRSARIWARVRRWWTTFVESLQKEPPFGRLLERELGRASFLARHVFGDDAYDRSTTKFRREVRAEIERRDTERRNRTKRRAAKSKNATNLNAPEETQEVARGTYEPKGDAEEF